MLRSVASLPSKNVAEERTPAMSNAVSMVESSAPGAR